MILLIDDAKEGISYDMVARTGEAGLLILGALQGNIEELYIDFDLGLNSNLNGAQVITDAIENNIELPSKITVVSTLPKGIEILKTVLLLIGYELIKDSTCRFRRIQQ